MPVSTTTIHPLPEVKDTLSAIVPAPLVPHDHTKADTATPPISPSGCSMIKDEPIRRFHSMQKKNSAVYGILCTSLTFPHTLCALYHQSKIDHGISAVGSAPKNCPGSVEQVRTYARPSPLGTDVTVLLFIFSVLKQRLNHYQPIEENHDVIKAPLKRTLPNQLKSD